MTMDGGMAGEGEELVAVEEGGGWRRGGGFDRRGGGGQGALPRALELPLP